jgi:hypothetical protein
MELEQLLSQYPQYAEIQQDRLLDSLLLPYLSSRKCNAREVGFIKECLTKDDLQSKAVIYHEKCEIKYYLEHGHTIEDVKSGVAHKSSYSKAHAAAERAHLTLYQHVSEYDYGYRLPWTILYITQPMIELNDSAMEQAYYQLKHEHNQNFSALDVNDVAKSITMFEKYGSKYRSSEFRKQCEDFVVKLISKK